MGSSSIVVLLLLCTQLWVLTVYDKESCVCVCVCVCEAIVLYIIVNVMDLSP